MAGRAATRTVKEVNDSEPFPMGIRFGGASDRPGPRNRSAVEPPRSGQVNFVRRSEGSQQSRQLVKP